MALKRVPIVPPPADWTRNRITATVMDTRSGFNYETSTDTLTVTNLTVTGTSNITSSGWAITTKTSNYTVLPANTTILVDTSSGNVTITLEAAPSAGRITIVKKIAVANTCTIDGNGNNIDGLATLDLSTYGESVLVQFDGSDWWIVG